jgi:nitroreductase
MKLKDKIMQVLWPKQLRRGLRLVIRPVLVKFPRLAGFYYAFDDSFSREFRGALAGQIHFEKSHAHASGHGGRYTLRRNTHRIEKGLIMRPQKGPFAQQYLQQTVELHAQLLAQGSMSDTSDVLLLRWSGDVLRRYFQVVPAGASKVVDKARAAFEKALEQGPAPGSAAGDTADKPHAPYERDLSHISVSYDDLLKLALRRRSVRWYLPKPVPRELIDNAIVVAGLSPSACNRQPFEFCVYDDPALVAKIAKIPGGTSGFAHNFPCFIVIVGKLRAFSGEHDRHVPFIDASLAAMALQFALEAQGLSSCCVNWQDHADQEREIERAMSLQPDERVIMCLSLGYPDPQGQVPHSTKKPLDELRSFNRQ